jgi:hypothetical protein
VIQSKGEIGGTCNTYGREESANRVLVEKPDGKNHLGDIGIDGRIILKLFLGKVDGGAWTGLIWLRMRTSGGHV